MGEPDPELGAAVVEAAMPGCRRRSLRPGSSWHLVGEAGGDGVVAGVAAVEKPRPHRGVGDLRRVPDPDEVETATVPAEVVDKSAALPELIDRPLTLLEHPRPVQVCGSAAAVAGPRRADRSGIRCASQDVRSSLGRK